MVTSISRILINFICTNSVPITEKHSDEICHALFNMPAPVIYNYIILPYNVHELTRWISRITIQLIDMTAIRHQFCKYYIRTYNSDLLRNSFLPLWVNWYIFWFSSNLDPQSKSLKGNPGPNLFDRCVIIISSHKTWDSCIYKAHTYMNRKYFYLNFVYTW